MLTGRGELFACVLDGSGRVRGAALRTPPRPMLAEVGYGRLCDRETIALEPAGEARVSFG
jgi:hypothetical protein